MKDIREAYEKSKTWLMLTAMGGMFVVGLTALFRPEDTLLIVAELLGYLAACAAVLLRNLPK